MAYTKTVWKDKLVQYPNRYKDQNTVVYTFTADTGTVVESGTPVNAENMNKIENELSSLDTGKSDKSTTVNVTLASTGWYGETAPYTYTLSQVGVTATNVIEVIPQSGITLEQAKSMSKAIISTGTQSAETLVLKAFGVKPTVDFPITLLIRGDI